MTNKLVIIAVIIGVAAIISYLATTFLVNTNTTSNLQQQEEVKEEGKEESPAIRDSERLQVIGECYDNPGEECDKQMTAMYEICQSETEEAASISCRDERLQLYVKEYVDRQP